MKKTLQEEAMDLAKAEALQILTEAVERAVGVLAGTGKGSMAAIGGGHRYMTKEEVKDYLNLPSLRTVDRLIRQKKLPFYSFGTRTKRFLRKDVDKVASTFLTKASDPDR